ncbi:oxygenase MpaB family protein [Streptomyces venezuelae]|uniref:oxygenase MpaB family protein n=1 Tax=Streptomyces venezuelae TaxID=54571 RepID=UPI001CC98642|nr:oxygenase MpaB family protein [Streptomyces venezuelae]
MGWPPTTMDDLRKRLGSELFRRVAGPSGPHTRARIHETPGPRWFGPDRPIRTVHGDASMFAGGLTALLLQSLHPLAMAAVAAHSGFRGDPWGRLHRTSTFLAVTTFGTAEDARLAVERVRAVHERVRGATSDGRAYHASDPHLLGWVHVAEVDSFLRAHRRYGAHPLDPAGYDGYVADTARIAEELGVERPPRNLAELARRLEAYRGELGATREARETARFLLLNPPIPWQARAPYALLAAAAVELLPPWARGQLGLPSLPRPAWAAARTGGRLATVGIRWAMAPPPPTAST